MAGGKNPAPLFGGNVGRKPNPTGFKTGSPEDLAAKRAADAERKRREYAAKKSAAPLPATAPPAVDGVEGAAPAQTLNVDFGAAPPPVPWLPDDLLAFSTQVVELGEGLAVENIARQCLEAKFPAVVVEKWKSRAAFPAPSKRSLSASLPGTLARAFNAVGVPVGLKSIITTAPALGIILMQQYQLRTELKKVIADEAAREKSVSQPQPTTPSKT